MLKNTRFFEVFTTCWSGGPALTRTFGPEGESEDENIMTYIEKPRKFMRIWARVSVGQIKTLKIGLRSPGRSRRTTYPHLVLQLLFVKIVQFLR